MKVWFLAMYTPDPWSWLVIAGMVTLGLAMYGYAGYKLLFPASPPAALG